MRLNTAAGWRSLLYTSILCSSSVFAPSSILVAAKKDKPSVKQTPFDFIPYNVNYFDDSDVLLFEDGLRKDVWRSEDAGETWGKVDGVPEGKLLELSMHMFDKTRAYIITEENTHYKTSDRGKTWQRFETDLLASIFREALVFHAADPDRILFNAMDCTGIFCEELTMYTTDGFEKDARFLRGDTNGCHWAKGQDLFTTGQKDLDKDRILCVSKGRTSPWRKDYRLMISDNFFQKKDGVVQEFEPELEPGRTVQGIVNMATVRPFLIVAATAEGTDEMALYTSDDSIKWHRAMFPHDHKLTENAYTVLEGTNYSIQIDVMNARPHNPMGVFLSSNSNGTYFTRHLEHTNRNSYGLVDFEKVQGIQGIMMANVVDNWEKVESSNAEKKIKSKISFDDGRTWQSLKYEGDDLHLHSVTDLSNSGRVFSSPAPGLVMGVGNTGSHLKDYMKGNLYVSDDAGVTWREGLEGPHKYEFGDQGSVLVAIPEGYGDEIKYSLNHGKDWSKVKLGEKVRPVQLTTTQDSTSLKFILEALDNEKPNKHGYIVAIDFDDMHEGQCKDSDMEIWHARVDEEGEPTCLMGHKQSYKRRKADADCFVKNEFEDPVPITEQCECSDIDFECDYNFVRSDDRKECVRAGDLMLPDGACKAFGPDDTFKGSSGWRLIPGNDCKRTSGAQKDDPVERKCVDAVGQPATGNPGAIISKFAGQNYQNLVYLERTGISTGSDETVLVRTEAGVFITHDHGKTWKQILNDEKIVAIYPHPYNKDMVFFVTPTTKVWYSTERGKNLRTFDAPNPPNKQGYAVMNFHQWNKDWIIWIGEKDGDHTVASVTTDRGDDKWKTLQRYVRKCEFIKEVDQGYILPGQTDLENPKDRDKMIFCEVRERESNDRENNPWKLVSSEDFFAEEPMVHFTDVVDFATMSEFVVVATKIDKKNTLRCDTSVDGKTFAEAKFPHGFEVDHQQGYTVLDSSTHSVFLHVTVSNEQGLEYGSIIKSNSNGTAYIHSLDYVNRDSPGYVDFEKTQGIEGIAVVNVVANAESKSYSKDGKKLKTLITHNDAAEWSEISPPSKDLDGKSYNCKTQDGVKCSLNMHGYTERMDKSHTYSSASAVGLMLATGNVGSYLSSPKDADTFMSADGGVSWKPVKKGNYMWEFGDQGSIVIIVKERAMTNVVHYTLDEGDTWVDYKFSEDEMIIGDLTTVPSDNSRNFLLWAKKGNDLLTINLDFSTLTDKQCTLDETNVEGGDYYLWKPRHPLLDDDCLFGHESEYHRKRTSAKCFNGPMIPHLHDIAKNCTCTRRDFECDFNYQRQSDGSCALVNGFTPPDHSAICKLDANAVEYYDPTGYRRIPITTCQGGKEMDISTPHMCPGHENEFEKKHGVSGVLVFFIILICLGAAGAIGWWVWSTYGAQFGQIRLGEQPSMDNEAPYIKYPVIVLSAIVAAAVATPLLIASLWRSAMEAIGRGSSRRFTTRNDFARGRDDYAAVDNDEGELLGEDSDEEV